MGLGWAIKSLLLAHLFFSENPLERDEVYPQWIGEMGEASRKNLEVTGSIPHNWGQYY